MEQATKLTKVQIAVLDAGELREHLADYVLTTFGTGEDSPVETGQYQQIQDRYVLSLAQRLARLTQADTTSGMLKQAVQDAADLAADTEPCLVCGEYATTSGQALCTECHRATSPTHS